MVDEMRVTVTRRKVVKVVDGAVPWWFGDRGLLFGGRYPDIGYVGRALLSSGLLLRIGRGRQVEGESMMERRGDWVDGCSSGESQDAVDGSARPVSGRRRDCECLGA